MLIFTGRREICNVVMENDIEKLVNKFSEDVGAALALISEQTAVCFEKYFPNDKPKLALAKFIRCLA